MNASLFKLFAAALLVIALVARFVWQQFDDQAGMLRAQHQQLIQERQAAWAQEDVNRALTAREAARVRQTQADADLVALLGSPLAAAAKNPDLTIQQMLTQIATAVAPPGTGIAVTVDRFTEFDVAFVLGNSMNLDQLATLTKHFFQSIDPCVHSLRFIYGNELLAELGGADIDSVTNWNSVSQAYVIGMLQGTSTVGPAAGTVVSADATATGTPDDPVSLDPDQSLQRTAQKNFADQYHRHLQHLNELLAGLNQASRLDQLPSGGVPARLAWLDQQTAPLNAEEDFLMNQDSELERAMDAQGVDPLITRILKRAATARLQPQLPLITAAFDAIAGNQAQIREFLQTMDRHQGEWEPLANSDKIHFSTPAALADYKSGIAQVTQSSETVRHALQSWTDAQSAK